MVKKSIHTDDKKNHILQVAEKLFAQYGFDGTTTRQIAQEAEVNLGLLSYYFGTKMQILESLIERKQNFYRNNLNNLRPLAKDQMSLMEAIVDMYIDHMLENMKFHRIVQQQVFHGKEIAIRNTMFKSIRKNFDMIQQVITEGIEKKEFRHIDAPLFVMSLIGTLLQFIRSEELSLQLLSGTGKNKTPIQKLLDHKERLRLFMRDYLHMYLKPRNVRHEK